MVEVMHNNDQLREQQRRRAAFKHFREGIIHFPPTFKLVPGRQEYNYKRIPSWTDRVLWKVRSSKSAANCSVQLRYYDSVPELDFSDHRPVVAGFEVAIKPQSSPGEQVKHRQGCSIM